MPTLTSDRSRLPADAPYVDEPPFFARIAWCQVLVLGGIGLAILAPLGLAIVLAA
ncbi:MAG TPA: hypothetical protein VF576_00330 [Rubricoccaceae bacterium]|jgi:hypothetical protein